MKISYLAAIVFSPLILCACDSTDTSPQNATGNLNETTANEVTSQSGLPAVTSVVVTGESGNYSFGVTIESPDTGCNQYADWWEVIRADGSLVYRRILAHSHVDEQPFTRSGSPVSVASDEEIIVRAHMNNSGYGEQVISGSVEQGLFTESLDTTFATELETASPLPESCAF